MPLYPGALTNARMYKATFCIIFLLSLTHSHLAQEYSPEFETGKLIDTVYCKSDSTHSYSLYLPFYYGEFKDWPVIIAFDPAARGHIPVELFTRSAERYGYIVVGSNDARNGPWEAVFEAGDAVLRDVRERFAIDKNRIYTTGFSGGSRAASAIGMRKQELAGVIGCGAGFSPGHSPNFNITFDYVGLIGNMDFNYQEMYSLDFWLQTFNVDHVIIEYAGGHDWPPEEVIYDAVTWLEFRAMDSDRRPVNNTTIQEYVNRKEDEISKYREQGRKYEEYRSYEFLINFMNGLEDLSESEAFLHRLMAEKDVQQEIILRKLIREKELGYIKEYRDAFRAYRSLDYEPGVEIQSLSYWKAKVKEANKLIHKGKTVQDTLLGIRIIDFIWRTAFMQYESVNNTDEHKLVPVYLDIWSVAQPQRLTPYYLLARYYSQDDNPGKAIDNLEMAVEAGFRDVEFLESDTLMNPLHNRRQFRNLIEQMQSYEPVVDN